LQPLGELIEERTERLRDNVATIYSVTNESGFVRSLDIFDKQVFSKDTGNYKRVGFHDLAYNPSRINVGSVALCEDESGGAVSPMYVIVRCKSGLLPRYLLHFLKSDSGLHQIRQRCEGAVRFQLKFRDLCAIPILVPSLSEQQRIVRLIDDAENLRELRSVADSRTSALIPAVFTDFFGDPSCLETMRWNSKPLGEFAKVSYGLADKLDAATRPEDGTRILTISNVLLNGTIDTDVAKYSVVPPAERAKARLQEMDLLFNWRNGSEEHVGKTAIWQKQLDGEVLHVSFLLKIRVDRSQVNPFFLWGLINRLRATGYFTRNARMQINRKFNASELSALNLPLPPMSLQNEFARRVAEIRELEATQSVSRANLDALFQSMLHRAFSGEL
jgi:type I restriction enzyme S subunit